MADWEDPVQRAAVWYLAAFAAVASVLLAGVQLSSFTFRDAASPWLASALVTAAVGAALVVIYLATRVLLPAFTVKDLLDRQAAARRKLSPEQLTPGELESEHKAWELISERDEVLRALAVEDGYLRSTDAPQHLYSMSINAADEKSRNEARLALRGMVASANRREIRAAFRRLRWITPIATAVLVASVLAWPSLAMAAERRTASAVRPIPVTVTLLESQAPGDLIGRGCTQRALVGVAIDGDLGGRPLVALPAQADCPAALLLVDGGVGTVTARED